MNYYILEMLKNYYRHWYCVLALFWQAQLDNISDSFEAFFGVL